MKAVSLKRDNYFKLLIFSILILFLFPFSFAQETNEQKFHGLILDWIEFHPGKFNALEGFTTPYLESKLIPDTSADQLLFIREPEIEFLKAGKGNYLREIKVTLIYRDSTDHDYELANRDTVPRGMISHVRKTRIRPLRGADPRWTKKYLLPGLGIASGITTVITLFYLRSR